MASAPSTAGRPGPAEDDLTARARIRDAAIARFAADGVASTSLKSIAADVGVSPPLVIHHFGSKQGLVQACDAYVAELVREQKRAAVVSGLDPFEALRRWDAGPPLLRYLARTLAEESPHVTALVDELVEDAIAYHAEAVERGVLTPTEYPRERAVVLTVWSLGALALHEHVQRLLGADLTGQPSGAVPYLLPAMEILTAGLLDPSFAREWREAMHEYRPDPL